jgi:hypothetical protein
MPKINFNYYAKCARVFVVFLRIVEADGAIKKTRLKVESDEPIKAGKEAEKLIRLKWRNPVVSVKYLHVEDTKSHAIYY